MPDVFRDRKPRAARLGRLWVPLLLVGGGAAVVAAEDRIVQVLNLPVMAKPGGMGAPVDTVQKNARLTVLEKQGTWLKVQTPTGKQGYVKEGALAAQSFSTGSGEVKGDAGTSGLNATLAGKGLEETAQAFASKNNLNPAPLDRNLKRRNNISADKYNQFQQQGRVGAYKR